MRNIEKDTVVSWEVDLAEIDPVEMQKMGEEAVRNLVEKMGQSVHWSPEQEVSLLRYENWKGEYLRIVNGEELVEEIARQDGWTRKEVSLNAELIDLQSDSKVGYVASKLATQLLDDIWSSQRQIEPIRTEVTLLGEGGDAGAGDGVSRSEERRVGKEC